MDHFCLRPRVNDVEPGQYMASCVLRCESLSVCFCVAGWLAVRTLVEHRSARHNICPISRALHASIGGPFLEGLAHVVCFSSQSLNEIPTQHPGPKPKIPSRASPGPWSRASAPKPAGVGAPEPQAFRRSSPSRRQLWAVHGPVWSLREADSSCH